MTSSERYPDNWNEIAYQLKEKAGWKCSLCGRQCLKPGEKAPSDWSKSKKYAYRLQVHHWDRQPENSNPANLCVVCSPCHLSLHANRMCNVSIGQLSLFD